MADIPWMWLGVRATGLTAWGLLTAVVLWGILLKTQLLGRVAKPMRLLDLHRWLGAVSIGFLLIHMALLFFDTYAPYSIPALLVPGLAPAPLTTAAALGTIAFWMMIPVSVLGRLRAKMGVAGNRWFSGVHLIAYLAWPVATAHYVLAGTDALAEWSLGLLFTGTALVVMALLARGFVPAPGPSRAVGTDAKRSLTSA